MSVRSLTCQQSVFERYIAVTNISQSFTYKMAAKINWRGYGTNYVTVILFIQSIRPGESKLEFSIWHIPAGLVTSDYRHIISILNWVWVPTLIGFSFVFHFQSSTLRLRRGDSVAEWLACWTQAQKGLGSNRIATLSGNSLRQTVHTHRAVHQAAKLVAALLRVAGVTAGLAESNGSLPPGLWLTSSAGWLPRTAISSGTLRSVIEYGLPLPFYASSAAK